MENEFKMADETLDELEVKVKEKAKVLMEEFSKAQLKNNFTYHPPKEEQIAMYTELRDAGKELAELIERLCPMSREKSIAMTKVEESIMWANASIARNT